MKDSSYAGRTRRALCQRIDAILKFIGAGITGSSGMMAEAFHSVADTTSRGLLLGEAANAKVLQKIKDTIEGHPNCERVVELLTMHLAPKQILINAHVKLKDNLVTRYILKSIEEIEERIKRAEAKVEMNFLETARGDQADEHAAVPQHIG